MSATDPGEADQASGGTGALSYAATASKPDSQRGTPSQASPPTGKPALPGSQPCGGISYASVLQRKRDGPQGVETEDEMAEALKGTGRV